MNQIRPLGPAVKAEVAAELNGLPNARITEVQDTAYVFTNSLADLELWFMALGGRIDHQDAGPSLTRWTLATDTDHGHGAPVLVHTLALDTDQIDADCAEAVA